ncbi:enoyl-CoA hydratase/isomerase family protein [Halobacillus litoralis]|uniref:Enoyl-CoA hydratase/isomerase family protein n=1 Tax=Halobacillus litoralis TaxID=45668 RepID=A0A410M8V1_9BACI|nr:enoyl-CoA hydratase/isomerase family protein [Halobacillus litoralis]QAS51110.1 enoyl-CoA hydratase/isomerase family protein [Halobacillus litoralis]
MSQVLVEKKQEGYVVLTLNRPHKMNAITKQMTQEFYQAIVDLKQNGGVKFLVVTGAGERAFCSGGDLNELHGEMSAEDAYQLLHPMKQALYELATFPVPTIALMNGQARGGGCEIATACDFRYGVESSSFGFVQGNLGITPGWGGGALLYQRIKADFAAHWLMDAEMYQTEQVYRIGWLHKMITDNSKAENVLFSSFLNKTLKQMEVFKQQYLTHIHTEGLSERMDQEVYACSQLWESEEHKTAVRNFAQMRKRS